MLFKLGSFGHREGMSKNDIHPGSDKIVADRGATGGRQISNTVTKTANLDHFRCGYENPAINDIFVQGSVAASERSPQHLINVFIGEPMHAFCGLLWNLYRLLAGLEPCYRLDDDLVSAFQGE